MDFIILLLIATLILVILLRWLYPPTTEITPLPYDSNINDWPICSVAEAASQIRDSPSSKMRLYLSNVTTMELQELIDALNLKNNPEIGISGACVKDLGAALISSTLFHANLTSIDLRNSLISNAGADAIASSLFSAPKLVNLDLGYNEIDDVGASRIFKSISKGSSLQRISLRSNRVGDGAVKYIERLMLANKAGPTIWDLSANLITDKGGIKIAEALPQSTVVSELHLSWNKIGTKTMEAFARALWGQQGTLRLLDVSHCTVPKSDGVKVAQWLSEALLQCHSLTSLGLGGLHLSDAGTAALSAVLKEPKCHIESLNLQACHIGSTGARSMAAALQRNSVLQTLDLSGNNIGRVGVSAFVTCLEVNETLTTLTLSAPSSSDDLDRIVATYVTLNALGVPKARVLELRDLRPHLWPDGALDELQKGMDDNSPRYSSVLFE